MLLPLQLPFYIRFTLGVSNYLEWLEEKYKPEIHEARSQNRDFLENLQNLQITIENNEPPRLSKKSSTMQQVGNQQLTTQCNQLNAQQSSYRFQI